MWKRTLKRSEYTDYMLKERVRAEDEGKKFNSLSEICPLVPRQEIGEVWQQLVERGWAKESVTFLTGHGTLSSLDLTPLGIDRSRFLMRPWYRKTWDALAKPLWGIAAGVIIVVVGGIILAIFLGWLRLEN